MWVRGLIIVLCLAYLKGCTRRSFEWIGYVDASILSVRAPDRGYLSLYVSEGEWVKKGQLLAHIHDATSEWSIKAQQERLRGHMWSLQMRLLDYQKENESAKEVLRSSYIEEARAQEHWQRIASLFKEHAISAEAFEEAKAQWELAKHAVRLAESARYHAEHERAYEIEQHNTYAELNQLRLLEQSEQDRYLYAASEGYIAKKYLQDGTWVTHSTPLLDVGIIPYKAVFYARAEEIPYLSYGAPLELETSTHHRAMAYVTRIDKNPVFTPPIVYAEGDTDEYRFRIEAAIHDCDLPAGQPITIRWNTP